MKKILLISISTIFASSFGYGDDAGTQPPHQIISGGTVNFQGELVKEACVVSFDTADQTIDLGQNSTACLKAFAQETSKVPFEIKLVNCDSKISSAAAFAFYGAADATIKDLLNIGTSFASEHSSQGVGIAIRDFAGNILAPDGTTFSAKTKLVDGNTVVCFTANYMATTDTVTVGDANTSVNFVIKYE